MPEPLLELYPHQRAGAPLQGFYLQHHLHQKADSGQAYIYSNFVTSLDGRIALPQAGKQSHQVPPEIANARDWRLYQELAAQADLLITSARYFRQLAHTEAQDLLPVAQGDAYADLHVWRREQGLAPQPDIAIVSASLDIPAQALQPFSGRRVLVLTGALADTQRIAQLEANDVTVIRAGDGHQVEGHALRAALAARGYRSLYAIAGPSVFYTLAAAGVLDRLYLTFAGRVLGGEDFDTIAWGARLQPPLSLHLAHLAYDTHAPTDAGQLLAAFDCVAHD